jgi:HlyD family secretion protein
VTLTLDALPETILRGQVDTIAPLSVLQSAVTSYQVRIAIQQSDPRVRPGMSTNADIVVDQRQATLILPRRALRSDRGQLVVDLVDPGLCAANSTLPQRPPLTARPVQIGLSNEQVVEILGGVNEQDCIYVEGIDARSNPLAGPPPGARR